MTSFQRRDPHKIGIAGLVALGLAIALAVNFDNLPLLGRTYQANFGEAAGLRPDSEVTVAGVKVGVVDDVSLEGDHVAVSFRVRDTWIGDRTTAAIKVKSLLGQKYLALDPRGSREQSTSDPIAINRTMTPYDVSEAIGGLSSTLDQIDTRQLADSFRVMSRTFSDTPDDVRGALTGLSTLSQTISRRDQQLHELLRHTGTVSSSIAERNAEFEKLLGDGNILLTEIRARRDAIRGLHVGTRRLSVELSGLVDENQAQLKPTLEQLDKVATMLQRNQDSLDRSLRSFAPFIRLFGNGVGTGRWADVYVCGLLPPSVGPINENGCQP